MCIRDRSLEHMFYKIRGASCILVSSWMKHKLTMTVVLNCSRILPIWITYVHLRVQCYECISWRVVVCWHPNLHLSFPFVTNIGYHYQFNTLQWYFPSVLLHAISATASIASKLTFKNLFATHNSLLTLLFLKLTSISLSMHSEIDTAEHERHILLKGTMIISQ